MKNKIFIVIFICCNTILLAQQRSNPISKAIVEKYKTKLSGILEDKSPMLKPLAKINEGDFFKFLISFS